MAKKKGPPIEVIQEAIDEYLADKKNREAEAPIPEKEEPVSFYLSTTSMTTYLVQKRGKQVMMSRGSCLLGGSIAAGNPDWFPIEPGYVSTYIERGLLVPL